MMKRYHLTTTFILTAIFTVMAAGFGTDLSAAHPEGRAVWVTRWAYTSGGLLSDTHKSNICRLMDRAVEGHFNIIVLQVRGQADAFYHSSYEPWAFELSGYSPGSLGTDPGWDPLQYAIEQAHQRGLELHAWLNTFNAWRGTTPPPQGIDPEHMYNVHPEWICTDINHTPMTLNSEYVSFSPGNPEVVEHVHNVAMDVLEHYDVDGIHFDYIRYPRDIYSRDFATDSLFFEQYGIYPDEDTELWKNWQRDRITGFLQNFYYQARAVKPMVKISAAVIGRYDVPSSGWDAYNTVYQDARLWVSRGIIDYLAPMIYWDMSEFAPLIRDWTHYSYGRHVYAGVAAYRADEFGGWWAIEAEIDTARATGTEGLLFFQSTSFDRSDGYYWNQIGQNRFSTLATVPPMWWKDPIAPDAPGNLQAVSLGDSLELSWEAPLPAADGDTAVYYGIYRTTGAAVDIDDPEQLFHLTAGPTTRFLDEAVVPGLIYHYAAVAYDDGDNESAPSTEAVTAVSAAGNERLPAGYVLHQNYPNPFNATTTIALELSAESVTITLQIYNVLGQRVATLLEGRLPPGRYHIAWDGTDEAGRPVASGIYFCRLRAGDWSQMRRMVLIR